MSLLLLLRGRSSPITIDLAAEPITFWLCDSNISNSLVILDAQYIRFATVDPTVTFRNFPLLSSNLDQNLRYENISLIEYIKQKLLDNYLFNVDVIMGYPEFSELTLPTIALDLDFSRNKSIEIGKHTKSIRKYKIYIYARTKGERDNFINLIESLKETEINRNDTVS
jgi:hypothetical protein